mmetsp:Transcript_27002/g.89627  ORF Transcript_27002/g.89627 Transcript_27002/m.89627 type:complete len:238 (-) Transcript_27002:1832-2545(-)
MIAMRSPRTSASSMKCVVRTVTRLSRILRMMFQVLLLLNGSIPEVGSSKKQTGGRPKSAKHKDNFRFCPPDKPPARVLAFSMSPTCAIMSCALASTSWPGTPRRRAKMTKCSRTVSSSQSTSCCGQTPMRRRISASSVRRERPATVASPDVGATMPVSMLTVVVLPAPLCPSSAKIWPSYIVSSRFATATFMPPGVSNSLRRPLASTMIPEARERARSVSDTGSAASMPTQTAGTSP